MNSIEPIKKEVIDGSEIWTIDRILNCSIKPAGGFANPYYLHFITKLEPLIIPILHLCTDKSNDVFGAHNANTNENEILFFGSSKFKVLKKNETIKNYYYETNNINEYDDFLNSIVGKIIVHMFKTSNDSGVFIYKFILDVLYESGISEIKDVLNQLVTDGIIRHLRNFFNNDYKSKQYKIFEMQILQFCYQLSQNSELSDIKKDDMLRDKFIKLLLSYQNNITHGDDIIYYIKTTQKLLYINLQYIDNNIEEQLTNILNYINSTGGGKHDYYKKYLKYKKKYISLKNEQ